MSTEPPPHLATRLTPWSCERAALRVGEVRAAGGLDGAGARPAVGVGHPAPAPTSAAAISATARLMGRRRTAARLYPSRQTGRRAVLGPCGACGYPATAATRVDRVGRCDRTPAADLENVGKRVRRRQVSHENPCGSMEMSANRRRGSRGLSRSPGRQRRPSPTPPKQCRSPAHGPAQHGTPTTTAQRRASSNSSRPTSCPCSHRSSARTADPQPWWRTSTRAPPGSTHLSPHCMRATMAGSRSEPFSVSR